MGALSTLNLAFWPRLNLPVAHHGLSVLGDRESVDCHGVAALLRLLQARLLLLLRRRGLAGR